MISTKTKYFHLPTTLAGGLLPCLKWVLCKWGCDKGQFGRYKSVSCTCPWWSVGLTLNVTRSHQFLLHATALLHTLFKIICLLLHRMSPRLLADAAVERERGVRGLNTTAAVALPCHSVFSCSKKRPDNNRTVTSVSLHHGQSVRCHVVFIWR